MMATGCNLQDDFPTCSVCMEVFNQPVILACQHSFCLNCLKKYLQTRRETVRHKSIPCPTCRQDTPVPHPDRPVEEWAGQLKPGLLLIGLMDMDDSKSCMMCLEDGKTTLASTWCADCQTCFCDECLKLHNKVPTTRTHDLSKLTGSKQQKLKQPFMCKIHEEKMKLFCKDCKKPLCTVCCSISHRKCEDVVTIKDMLPEVKSQLQKSHRHLDEIAERNKIEIAKYGDEVEYFLMKSASMKTDITKAFQASVDRLREKETELLEELVVKTNQLTDKLRSMMQTKQTKTQMYQQLSQFIQQALELEDEAQLFEMYLSPGSEAGEDIAETQRKDMIDVADICSTHDLDKLKDEIGKMDVRCVDDTTATPDLTGTPVLHEVIDAKLGESDTCSVRDVVVLKQAKTEVTLFTFTHLDTHRLKAFYLKQGQTCSSVLQVSPDPRCITVISENSVAVSFLSLKNIIIVTVTPALELLSKIQTSKKYICLSSLDKSTLVAGSMSPPAVDLIDMEGNVLTTFTSLPGIGQSFRYPQYIHVTRRGTILVSDYILKSVICLTQSGDIVFTYTPIGDRALINPYGITSTTTGDILVADYDTHKVIHLSRSGEFIRDILTTEDGLINPFGLCIDEDKLCVTVVNKGLHKYKFVNR